MQAERPQAAALPAERPCSPPVGATDPHDAALRCGTRSRPGPSRSQSTPTHPNKASAVGRGLPGQPTRSAPGSVFRRNPASGRAGSADLCPGLGASLPPPAATAVPVYSQLRPISSYAKTHPSASAGLLLLQCFSLIKLPLRNLISPQCLF